MNLRVHPQFAESRASPNTSSPNCWNGLIHFRFIPTTSRSAHNYGEREDTRLGNIYYTIGDRGRDIHRPNYRPTQWHRQEFRMEGSNSFLVITWWPFLFLLTFVCPLNITYIRVFQIGTYVNTLTIFFAQRPTAQLGVLFISTPNRQMGGSITTRPYATV